MALTNAQKTAIKALIDGSSASDAYIAGYPLAKGWKPETIQAKTTKLFTTENIKTVAESLPRNPSGLMSKEEVLALEDKARNTTRHKKHSNEEEEVYLTGPLKDPKQERFCQLYVIDLNVDESHKKAGYRGKHPDAGQKIFAKPNVQRRIRELQHALNERFDVTAREVRGELIKMAFRDVRTMLDENGMPLPVSNLDDFTAAAIDSLKFESHGDTVRVKEVKMVPKMESLKELAKHMGIAEKHEISGPGGGPIPIERDMSPEAAAEIYRNSLKRGE